ncbi:hypothetical protein HOY80DRAFT_160738 [Tuber brumale]|nr:hypothetical protein HOY80DRAFT_160738 [Tuber brumale]
MIAIGFLLPFKELAFLRGFGLVSYLLSNCSKRKRHAGLCWADHILSFILGFVVGWSWRVPGST